MDHRPTDDLAEWIEFYRELGFEDFYQRASSAPTNPQARPSIPPEDGAGNSSAPQDRRALGDTARVALAEPAHLQSPPPSAIAGRLPHALSLFEAPPARRELETLEDVRNDLGDCHRCRLAAGRKTIVFGQGNPRAELVFVGEGPGADEDEQGLPFVGRAGRLLNRMIQAVGMSREEVYICNIVKCRPPGNRTPAPDEIESCSPFLYRQIESIRPRLVCCLGAPAVRTLLGVKEGITKIRGRFYDFAGAKALATVHPAYILRNPREEKILLEDFQKIRDFLKSS